MTRKDYKAIAEVIAEAVAIARSVGVDCEAGERRIAEGIAEVMERDNERFDRTRFMTACNLQGE